MAKRRILLLITVVLFSAIVLYLLPPSEPSKPNRIEAAKVEPPIAVKTVDSPLKEPLPPVGEPLIAAYHALSAHAQAGEPIAASRLFNDTRECLIASRLAAGYQQLSKDKTWVGNNPALPVRGSIKGAEDDEATLSGIDKGLDRIDQDRQLCAGMLPNLNDGRIYRMALDAARLGDNQATACLLISSYEGPPISQEDGYKFGREVMALGEAAINRGDWKVAVAMTYVYSGATRGGYSSFVTHVDPKAQLQYSQLVRYGTPDGTPDATNLDHRLSLLSDMVSPDDRASASAWASQMYRKSYLHSGPVYPDTQPCEF